ncbi:MAG: autotransporter-associated beta strand repeat-containing protein [Pirellulales bacterium]|nr:autotransporter-associated beta strand repeat-containing protein [Pirellulales bacterium]
MKWSFKCSTVLLLVSLGWAVPLPVQAQGTYYYWNVSAPNTGYYGDTENWVDSIGNPAWAVPSTGDSAIIKNDGPLVVDIDHPIGDMFSSFIPFQILVGAGTIGPLDPSAGHVQQTGSDVYFENYLCVGTDSSPDTSTWTMTGGTINQTGTTGGLYVGDVANGSMTVENASITVNNILQIAGGAEGTMTLNSGAAVGAKYLEVGRDANAVGTLTMNDATATFTGTADSSVGYDGAGSFELSGAANAEFTGKMNVGYGSGNGSLELSSTANATFSKLNVGYNGGTGSVSLSGSATINAPSGFSLGYNGSSTVAGGYGNLTISGGTLTARNLGMSNDAQDCTNDITMTGGAILLERGMTVGYAKRNEGLGSATLDMSGDSVITISSGSLEIAWGGTGTVLLGSGNAAENAKITSTAVVYLGYSEDSFTITNTQARLDLNAGGTLEAPGILSGVTEEGGASVASSIVNFNGGTLRATTSATDYIINAGGALEFKTNVQSGGAIIDTNGFDITISTPLTEDAGSTGGGLTKLGAGTLTLSSAEHTYTGNTTIEESTLSITNNTVFDDDSVVTIADSALLNLDFASTGDALEVIGGLYFDNVLQDEGSWGALGNLYADFTSAYLTGTGLLYVGGIMPVPGDTDGDRDIDAADAAVLARNWLAYNPSFDYRDGDFNKDGWVNDLDASILAANWNPGGAEAAGKVPEPSVLASLLGLALSLFACRRYETRSAQPGAMDSAHVR